MLLSELKTIDIQILEWFDKTYGNTYFASRITLNYGLEAQTEMIIPFTYGHGNHAEFKSYEKIDEYFNLNKGSIGWRYCNDNNIIVRTNKRDALKRELKNI